MIWIILYILIGILFSMRFAVKETFIGMAIFWPLAAILFMIIRWPFL